MRENQNNMPPKRKTSKSKNKTIQGDCLEIFKELPKAKMVFADPPDNLGAEYDGYEDKLPNSKYRVWFDKMIDTILLSKNSPDIFWLSYYYKYQQLVFQHTGVPFVNPAKLEWRQFIWRFTFGQHRHTDCGNGYRPIMRWMKEDAIIYPDVIRVPSARQSVYNDKRANPKGRVPDDVWDFSRVCGTFNERRKWHPTQHPEALMERIIKFSCVPGDLVIDLFAGSGTTQRVCKRLNIACIGIDISESYCEKIKEELK